MKQLRPTARLSILVGVRDLNREDARMPFLVRTNATRGNPALVNQALVDRLSVYEEWLSYFPDIKQVLITILC